MTRIALACLLSFWILVLSVLCLFWRPTPAIAEEPEKVLPGARTAVSETQPSPLRDTTSGEPSAPAKEKRSSTRSAPRHPFVDESVRRPLPYNPEARQ